MPLSVNRIDTSLNLRTYFILSFLLAFSVACSHYLQYQDFYLVLLSIISSSSSVIVFENLFLVLSIMLGYVVKSFFLGNLRDTEIEFLYEKVSPTLFDVVLSFSLFRTPFNVPCILMLVVLFFFKCFHWLIQKRVDFVGQISVSNCASYFRLMALIVLFFALDLAMIKLSIKKETTMTIFLLYKFEFALLTLSICLFAKKYLIILYDLYRFHGQWEEKNVLIMLLELFGDFCRMLLNIFLFVSMVNSIGLPLHLTRQFAESIMLFRKRLIEFVRYRKATKNMNQRFPNATPEQIAQVNHICVICRETMTQGKILQCGHILHLKCLREWLEHQQSCPTCRLPVLETNQETRNDSSNVATRSPPSSPLDTPPPSEQSLFFPASVSNPPMPAIPVQEGPADRQDAAIQDPSGSRPFSLSWDSNLTQQGQPIQYASVPFVQVPFSSQLPQLPQGAVFLSGVQSSTEASSRIEHMLSSIERRIDSLQQQVQEIRQIVSQRT